MAEQIYLSPVFNPSFKLAKHCMYFVEKSYQMKEINKPDELLSLLKTFEGFKGISEDIIQWVVDKSVYKCFEKGEVFFRPGDAVNDMIIVTEGEYVLELEQKGTRREIGKVEAGEVSGALPFSRLKEAKTYGLAVQNVKILYFDKENFTELVNKSYDLVQNLVGLMSDRVREYSQRRSQDEKLMSLGKLSAGLAHELNNPASAMVRSAKKLHNKLHQTPEKFKNVMRIKADNDMIDAVNDVLFSTLERGVNNDLSTLDRNDLEDDLTDWLDDHEIENLEDKVETFTDYNMSVEKLEEVRQIMGENNQTGAVLGWIENVLSTEKLIREIKESSDRIAQLVRSVKGYSHMDKAPVKEDINIKDGIISTIIMLKHKIKAKQITLEKNFDESLPQINAYGGELNQVWTNIIDNAVDAMPKSGTLLIKTYKRGNSLCVDITDSGEGISDEDISCIFDPFFTTKKMNEGTGMGLDIVKKIISRNQGDIQVESKPGRTTFTVCFPI